MPASDPGFAELVGRRRAELHAHCYRMLGSLHDADDALQETLLRAWRGGAGLREPGSTRAWLYAIATNVCLTELQRRSRRALPRDLGPAAADGEPPGRPAAEAAWIEPYPDAELGLPSGVAGPAASYEQHEAIELAFIAALQNLAVNQRATLILRDVLGFTAPETATVLETTVASVTSALQRARVAVRERVGERSQQANLRTLGDSALSELVSRYVAAWERGDVEGFVGMLCEDATFAMPPMGTWYAGRSAIGRWARTSALSGAWRWRALRVRSNGQPALGFYALDPTGDSYEPFALNVLSVRDDGLVADVTAFIVRAVTPDSPARASTHAPQEPADPRRLDGAFTRFGLPASLPTVRV
jgi:RNA polymerase sigma-70 factor, ECF subfamily